jgi:branched-subunit amino acid transport protein
MSAGELWLVILSGMLITYFSRLSFIAFDLDQYLPPIFRRGLRFVPIAVLAAIIGPELTLNAGRLDLTPDNHRLLAGLAAALIAWRTRNIWLTILVGIFVLWLLSGR